MYKIAYHTESLSDKTFLVTGGAGFIGSNLVEYLLKYGAGKVRVLDNLSNGHFHNLEEFITNPNFEFIEGDIKDLATCQKACDGMDYVAHQAALGSVPRSINDPISTNEVNISGFLNILVAARDKKVKRFVYAASSSTYGDSKELPKVEDRIGKPLSPYAVTKYVNELYAEVFTRTYGIETIGLRYFNVFGPKQDPNGVYAAVIPLFIKAIKENRPAVINGDGETTRDFTFVENVIQANVKALLTKNINSVNQIYNVACGKRISLNKLWDELNSIAGKQILPIYSEQRSGDIRDSIANINKIEKFLSYETQVELNHGLLKTFGWNVTQNE